MKLLLLGRNGQTGWELQRALAPLGEVVAPARNDGNGLCGDLTRPEMLAKTVRNIVPDVIVNAAAYTAVDRAESEPDLARTINAEAPGILGGAALECNALLVHYSSDYVFDGSGTVAWQETDVPEPLNVYGQTKLEGEELIRNSGCRHLILRTSWLYAARGNNFIRTMLRLAAERDTLKVVNDQFGAPTGADLIADVTAHVVIQVMKQPELYGTYHLAAKGETTWFEYARFIITRARAGGLPVKVTDEAIVPVPGEEFPTPALRPGNSRLNCTKLEHTFNLQIPDWRGGVERTVRELCGQ